MNRIEQIEAEGGFETPEEYEKRMTIHHVPNCTKPDCPPCLKYFREHFMDDIEDL